MMLLLFRFRVTKCEKPAKDRRTIMISESNGSVPSTPTEVARRSRRMSESQQVGALLRFFCGGSIAFSVAALSYLTCANKPSKKVNFIAVAQLALRNL